MNLEKKLQDACDYPEKVKEMKAQAADFICKKIQLGCCYK